MNDRIGKVFFLILFISPFFNGYVFAVEEKNQSEETKGLVNTVKPQQKKLRGKVAREKEAEGTKAPNRFDSEVIIKSQYKLNGQSLEVDTD